MIIKSFELNKINYEHKFFLLYGENQGHKSQVINKKFKEKFSESVYLYEESEILKNQENFFNTILSKSFFEKKKLIIIDKATDTIKNLIEEIIEKKIDDLVIVLNSNTLEKKSKLRGMFEKDKIMTCIPFYEDTNQTLNSIISHFFRNKKIAISQQLINILIERSRGDRKNLYNELDKIESFCLNKKTITSDEIIKLTNLADNYSASELIDNCLAKNTRKTVAILNENNYSDEDSIIIIRTLLAKLKRLVKICELADEKDNIDQAVSSFKPPIFWKDKPLVTQQIISWKKDQLKNLIYESNEIELLIKKNSSVAKNILSNFIINKSRRLNN
ncbi:DNA polymerase III subunit delta [Candidatus Pelagibacter sp.]|nr:DNA polymerase III subunit delta [Candidatus Pelagibacter sp.]